MRKAGAGIGLVWFLFSVAVLVFAQGNDKPAHNGKPGLWEITTTTTWQKAPVTPGTPGGPPRGGTHTAQFCLTQEMIDAGALLPQSRGSCHIQDKTVKPGSVLALYVCSGKMNGKGLIETTFSDLEHAHGSIHFEGTFDVAAHAKPIEWTTISTSTFKSAQCTNSPAPPAPPHSSAPTDEPVNGTR